LGNISLSGRGFKEHKDFTKYCYDFELFVRRQLSWPVGFDNRHLAFHRGAQGARSTDNQPTRGPVYATTTQGISQETATAKVGISVRSGRRIENQEFPAVKPREAGAPAKPRLW